MDWVMLDCYMRRSRLDDGDSSALTAAASTSTGERVSVALSAAAPPWTSRILFDWCPKEESSKTKKKKEQRQGNMDHSNGDDDGPRSPGEDAKVAAAHRGCMLLRFVRRRSSCQSVFNPRFEEWFVYQAHRRDGSGEEGDAGTSLTRLPACRHELIYDGFSNMGILGGPDDDHHHFVVAHLAVTPTTNSRRYGLEDRDDSPATADLCVLRRNRQGGLGRWRATRLPIRHGEGERHHLHLWQTDAVVALGDGCLCWVDYLRGVLLCDVSGDDPGEVRYVPLPVRPYSDPDLGGRARLAAFRSLSAVTTTTEDNNSNAATLKFVDVAPNNIWFAGTPEHPFVTPRRNTITTWTLGRDRRSWTDADAVDDDAFYALIKDTHLPIVRPELPLVDARDPQTIYFVMQTGPLHPCSDRYGDAGSKPTFLIAVDMPSKTIAGYLPYVLTGHGSLTNHRNTISCNLLYMQPFVPSEFLKYLQGRDGAHRTM
ncbi:uncharacterized protein C2845_PM05G09700 [Panicum miliaceum]|uniref:DUF1618 domain-containing protein n=1 Tax=Panicum miliaceum TaxID=4540 RepID=A0A3L6SWR5_PANMI|nr:uncharacterized protein C2845_PM05G09700 [Panicum miliaceum]